MSRLKIGVLASGRGSNLQALLDACAGGNIPAEVAVVLSDISDAYALQRARQSQVPALHVDPAAWPGREQYEQELVRLLQAHGVELVCLAGYMRLVGRVMLQAFPGRIMNIHPSLLPAFPGLHAQKQALDYGVRFTGCTVHFVDEGMDSGPIILQAVVPVLDGDDEASLAARILEQEHQIYPRAVDLFARGRLLLKGRRVCILE
ncbi:MAG: phosphoribosylglycinamide formyltransferase [Desulfurispora sp.]|uniref:phosphoribosylglycinamide formyltransferase n=1 Tax=Desulfurispora sp. TaxID=3014275 RepID=UPI00404A0869